ncbi:MAG: transcriptional repressor [Proteobacteria bacterium]|nr:transcriptional repressor [Pseudomonadota bacterium]
MKRETAHCDPSQTLRNAGLAKTTQRMAVLEKLIGAACPLNARDILTETRGKLKINRVTIYRILASFRDGGIIREIEAGSGTTYYEMACHHNPIHPHFHCRRCGSLTCMPPLTLSQALDWLVRPYNFSVESINVHITGICGPCRERDDRNGVASKGDEAV